MFRWSAVLPTISLHFSELAEAVSSNAFQARSQGDCKTSWHCQGCTRPYPQCHSHASACCLKVSSWLTPTDPAAQAHSSHVTLVIQCSVGSVLVEHLLRLCENHVCQSVKQSCLKHCAFRWVLWKLGCYFHNGLINIYLTPVDPDLSTRNSNILPNVAFGVYPITL